MDEFYIDRENMVLFQIKNRNIKDERILRAMLSIPRHEFLPESAQRIAYGDHPIRIDRGQTISQPYIVALMTELLKVKRHHKVLEVGTGSGYQAAILAELAKEVYTLERFPKLADSAREVLKELGYQNIHVLVGDGTLGYPPAAPYDRIIVTAAAPKVPDSLLDQLGPSGRLVIPVGSRHRQNLEVWDHKKDKFKKSVNVPVVFVPLIGEEGWKE